MPIIPALGRLRQEDGYEFETSLGYKSELKASLNCIATPCLKKTNIGPAGWLSGLKCLLRKA